MDTLSDVLSVAAVTGSVAACVAAGGRWGLQLNDVPGAAFHVVTAGVAWLTAADQPPVRLMPGDAVLLPTGVRHTLSSDLGVATTPFDHADADRALDAGRELVVGDEPATTRILCASYRHDPAGTIGTFALLPPVVHLPASTSTPATRATLTLLADELDQPRPGARPLLDHVVNVLLIQVLRSWIARPRTELPPSWLRGLSDPVTAAALAVLHERPAQNWTTEGLARHLATSRATLNRRFTQHVGDTPLGYLTRWRMELAAHALRTGDESVGAIAHRVGYTSQYAFSRAFTRAHGQPPGRYRAARELVVTNQPAGH